ncbi:MAG: alpha/beta hydrolase [Pseudonocardiales bacterium]
MSTRRVEAFTHRFIPAHTAGALTLLLLHGTGGDENDLLELGRALDGQAALLSPRGQVSERGTNRWFRRLAEGVFDTDDLLARTDQLATFVTSAAAHYRLDASRLAAVGFPTAPTSPPRCCCATPTCCVLACCSPRWSP